MEKIPTFLEYIEKNKEEILTDLYMRTLNQFNESRILNNKVDPFLDGVLTGIELAIQAMNITLKGVNDRE